MNLFKHCKYLVLIPLISQSMACGESSNYKSINGFVQGTTYQITYNDPKGRDLKPEIEHLLSDFDNSLSIYNPHSTVTAVNNSKRADTIKLENWFVDCFRMAQTVSEQTDGYFDITVKPLTTAYGFAEIDNDKPSISSQMRDSLLKITGYKLLTLTSDNRLIRRTPGVQLDFNAIAKGYSVDLVAAKLETLNIKDYLVEIGGEIFCKGRSSKGENWTVGIDKPFEGNFTPGQDLQAVIMMLSGRGLATSGNYRKFKTNDKGEKITHTINPLTGESVVHTLLSATIIGPSTAIADAYATACMVGGLEWSNKLLAKHHELEGYLIYTDSTKQFKVSVTRNMVRRIKK